MNTSQQQKIMSLDVGSVRIGLALASTNSFLAQPYMTILNNETLQASITKIIEEQNVKLLVVGMPRNLSGEKTKQSDYVEKWVNNHLKKFDIKIVYQDETLTSVKAEEILEYKKNKYKKSEVDSQAAALILDDFLLSNSPK